tara:strand:- start:15565 stop:16617 length:1053 start_codon:yes stop_codon:yes gene_type:complete
LGANEFDVYISTENDNYWFSLDIYVKSKLLVTGFVPFSSHRENISEKIIKILSSEGVTGTEIDTLLLSVDEHGSRAISEILQTKNDFTAFLLMGLAENAEKVRIERFARNSFAMKTPDNSGRMKNEGEIIPGSETVVEAIAPIQAFDEMIHEDDRICWSTDAGGFVCNETYYRTLISAREVGHPNVIFTHLPSESILPVGQQLDIIQEICRIISKRQNLRISSGLILDDSGRVLSCRRKHRDKWSGYWEFPGGKIEVGESSREAVIRELLEELNVIVKPGRVISQIEFSYEYRDIIMDLWHCGTIDRNDIIPNEHDQIRWLDKDELLDVDWLPADSPIIESWAENGIPIV